MSAAKDNADVSPLFIEIRPGMRKALADAVEAFLNLLDQIDADADLEDADAPEDDVPCEDVGDDEPSLGGLGGTALGGYFNQAGWAQGASDDREDEHDGCEPGGDDEPTLRRDDRHQSRACLAGECGRLGLMRRSGAFARLGRRRLRPSRDGAARL